MTTPELLRDEPRQPTRRADAPRAGRMSEAELSRAAHLIATGQATYGDVNEVRWPNLPLAIAYVAGTEQARVAREALQRLDPAEDDLENIGWMELSRRLNAWTLRPHDLDPEKLRRDDPEYIAARLRGRET